MLSAKELSILNALEAHAPQDELEIVSVEVVGARKAPTIRVFIDTPDGIGFDELASAQSWINDVMDEMDPFPGAYTLEVSSPGIDRPLRTPEHFNRWAGEQAVITLSHAVDGRSKWTGTLQGCKDGVVMLDCEGNSVAADIDNIKRAHIKGVIDFNG